MAVLKTMELFEDLATVCCDRHQGFRYSDFHPPFEEEEETNDLGVRPANATALVVGEE